MISDCLGPNSRAVTVLDCAGLDQRDVKTLFQARRRKQELGPKDRLLNMKTLLSWILKY